MAVSPTGNRIRNKGNSNHDTSISRNRISARVEVARQHTQIIDSLGLCQANGMKDIVIINLFSGGTYSNYNLPVR